MALLEAQKRAVPVGAATVAPAPEFTVTFLTLGALFGQIPEGSLATTLTA